MSKYDKMIELNRERSVEKVVAAKAAIRKMAEDRAFKRLFLQEPGGAVRD